VKHPTESKEEMKPLHHPELHVKKKGKHMKSGLPCGNVMS
jgi:hypothetical protein